MFNQKSDGTVISWNLAVNGEGWTVLPRAARAVHSRGKAGTGNSSAVFEHGPLCQDRELPSLYNPGPALGSVRGTLDVLLDAQLVVES